MEKYQQNENEDCPHENVPEITHVLRFDYSRVASDDRSFIMQKTSDIHILARRTQECIIHTGKYLHQIKKRLPRGTWIPWLKTEFDWSDRTAQNFMNVASKFKSENPSDLKNIAASALYLLSAPSTSEEAVDLAMKKAKSGKVNSRDAKKIIREAKQQNEETEYASEQQLGEEIQKYLKAQQIPADKALASITDKDEYGKILSEDIERYLKKNKVNFRKKDLKQAYNNLLKCRGSDPPHKETGEKPGGEYYYNECTDKSEMCEGCGKSFCPEQIIMHRKQNFCPECLKKEFAKTDADKSDDEPPACFGCRTLIIGDPLKKDNREYCSRCFPSNKGVSVSVSLYGFCNFCQTNRATYETDKAIGICRDCTDKAASVLDSLGRKDEHLTNFEKITRAGIDVFILQDKSVLQYESGTWAKKADFPTKTSAKKTFSDLINNSQMHISTCLTDEWQGSGKDYDKLMEAGFHILRMDRSRNAIKKYQNSGSWKDSEKFGSEAEMKIRFRELLENPGTLSG